MLRCTNTWRPLVFSICQRSLKFRSKSNERSISVSSDRNIWDYLRSDYRHLPSVTNVRACEPEPRSASRESRAYFCESLLFFSYLFIFWRFQFNVNVFLSKWFTLQKKHKFSIFLRAWNSANVVAVVCWGLVYIQIWMKFWASLANVDYVKLTNIQIYTGKRLSEANFRYYQDDISRSTKVA